MWLSLFTSLLCVVAMFLISWPVALATIAIVAFFYFFVIYWRPGKLYTNMGVFNIRILTFETIVFADVNWGSSTQAHTYKTALTSIQQLVHVEDHVKNYRPQMLVLTELPGSRPALVGFANMICKKNSMVVCAHVTQVHINRSRGRLRSIINVFILFITV